MNNQYQKQLKKIVQRIVREYKPEKIYLFGSFAWGKPDKDSDVDLLIIKRTKEGFFRRHLAVRKIIDGEIPVDVLVRTPSELKKRLNLGDFFYQDILKKGKCLYAKSGKKF
jgi:predicted nucleotidyltransferase